MTHTHRRPSPCFVLLACCCILPGRGSSLAAQWRVEGWLGTAWNTHSAMTISQRGQPDIVVRPNWSTNPWDPTWYYAGRVSKWSGNRAWAFEYIHHKLYLDNPPAEVEFFRITNGVNFFLAERLWRKHRWEFGFATGPVFLVPISKIRGGEYNKANGIWGSQYDLGGAALSADATFRLMLIPWVHGSLSLRGTAAALKANIADGKATMMNYALHLNYGMSLQSKRDAKHP